jgi:hypothetical protein
MFAPSEENATSRPVLAGKVAGSLYFVPNPALQGYADTLGSLEHATAMFAPSGENATAKPFPAGTVAGLLYFVPNPALQGYADTAGVVV